MPVRAAPAPPEPDPQGLRAMFRSADGPRQWPTALRTAVGVAVPAVVGLALGDLPAGLLASLGGFAGLYGGGRPSLNRIRLLLGVAVALSVAVGVGIWAGGNPVLSLVIVVVIAVLATWVCNALDVRPGAYQFALGCAAGSAIEAAGADPVRTALLVLSGGLLVCLVTLVGALVDPRGPERDSVGAAAEAVAAYLQARGSDAEDDARNEASVSMHRAWITLVYQQPNRAHPGRGLLRLREIGRQLQLILTDAMRGRTTAEAAERARRLGRAARRRSGSGSGRDFTLFDLPLSRPGPLQLLRGGLDPHSRSLLILVRVAVAAAITGTIGMLFGLTNAYWATATAVLLLSPGLDQRRTLQRGLERTLGTGAGVAVTVLVLLLDPQPLVLIGCIAAAVFAGQLLITRNYASAAVFITCAALLMTGGSRPGSDPLTLLGARALDTAIGCAVALLVFVVISRKSPTAWLPDASADALHAAAGAIDQLTPTTVTSPAGLAARRDLQRRLITLADVYANAINGYPGQRVEAEHAWPTRLAVERLAYRVLAEGWRLQDVPDGEAATTTEPPPSAGVRQLAEGVRSGRTPTGRGDVPSFLSRDVADLRRVLAD